MEQNPPSPPASSLPPGLAPGLLVANKYELIRRIGTGAMGEVWAARHKTLHEHVAIKLVLRNVEHEDGTSADSRFLLEARVAAQLSRKTRHIVAVTDHGQDGALGYLVMELLEGESLDQRLQRSGAQPLAKVAPMITQIARGLSIAHGEGVVHRDLKPSNVFVTLDEDGNAVVKVLDFGIAKLRRGLDRKAAHATQRGFLLGTPAYMSPEQARGKPLDHRADVWALAVIAYHMLTNEFPFDGHTGEELFARLCRIEPMPIELRLPDVPPVVSDFFARAFAQRIEDRFQSALALAGAFEQLEPLAANAALSLPPPPALGMIDGDFASAGLDFAGDKKVKDDDKTMVDPSLFVAGVPRRRKLVPLLAAALLLCTVLIGTGMLLGIYYERDPARTATTVALVTSTPVMTPSRVVPPPEESAPPTPGASATSVVSSDDLPPVTQPRIVRPASRSVTLVAPVIDTPPTVTSIAPVIVAPARTSRNLDKGEVF